MDLHSVDWPAGTVENSSKLRENDTDVNMHVSMFDSDIIVWPNLSKIVGVATASPPNAACSPPGGDSLNSAEPAAAPFGETKGSTGGGLDEPFVTSQGPNTS